MCNDFPFCERPLQISKLSWSDCHSSGPRMVCFLLHTWLTRSCRHITCKNWQPCFSKLTILSVTSKHIREYGKKTNKFYGIQTQNNDFFILLRVSRFKRDVLSASQNLILKQKRQLFGNRILARVWQDFCGPASFALNQVSICASYAAAGSSMMKRKLQNLLFHASSPPALTTSPKVQDLLRLTGHILLSISLKSAEMHRAFGVIKPPY